jgi:hypothetical protein
MAGEQETGVAVNAFTNALKLLLDLLKGAYKVWLDAPERRLKKLEIAAETDKIKRDGLVRELGNARGEIEYKKLEQSGVLMSNLKIDMAEQDFKRFASQCKREDVAIAPLDMGEKDAEGRTLFRVFCKAEDTTQIRNVLERMNEEKLVAQIDERIGELEAKGENATGEEKAELGTLRGQKDEIQRVDDSRLNTEQSEAVFDQAANGETKRGFSFDDALNRFTGGAFDANRPVIVAAASDPEKYIRCESGVAEFRGEKYLKTDYTVHNHGKKHEGFTDERFEGRQSGYWDSVKDKMREVGGFPEDAVMIKFANPPEYEAWRDGVKEQNAAEISADMENVGGDGRNYDGMVARCEEQLDADGCYYDHNTATIRDKATGELYRPTSDEKMDDTAKMLEDAKAAEIRTTGRQIANYENQKEISDELTRARIERGTAAISGTPEQKAAAQDKYEVAASKMEGAAAVEGKNLTTRKRVNSIQEKYLQEQREPLAREKEPVGMGERKEQNAVQRGMARWRENVANQRAKANDGAAKKSMEDKVYQNARGAAPKIQEAGR